MDDLQAIADGADGVTHGLEKLLHESEQYMKILSLAGQSTGDAYTTFDNVRQLAKKLGSRIEHLETSSSSGPTVVRSEEVVYQAGISTPYVYTDGVLRLYRYANGVYSLSILLPTAVCVNKNIYLWLRVRPSEGTSWKGTLTVISNLTSTNIHTVSATITNATPKLRIDGTRTDFDIIQCTLGEDIGTTDTMCNINIYPFYWDMEEVDIGYYAEHKAELLTETS